METAGPIQPFISMRAEKVSLRLDEIGREPVPAVGVEIAQRGGQGGGREALARGGGHHCPQVRLRRERSLAQIGCQEEIGQLRVAAMGNPDGGLAAAGFPAAARGKSLVFPVVRFYRAMAQPGSAISGPDSGPWWPGR